MFRFLPQLLRQLHSDEYAALPYDETQRAVALEAAERLPESHDRLNVPVAPFAYDRRATALSLELLNRAHGETFYRTAPRCSDRRGRGRRLIRRPLARDRRTDPHRR